MLLFFKKTLKFLLFLLSPIAFWFLCAWLFPEIIISQAPVKCQKNITIYVKSNGVHTDIVIPKINSVFNWDTIIDPKLFKEVDSTYNFISIGWGDKGFYLDTPTWNDLKVSTVCYAAFGLGSTAMHVTYYRKIKCGDRIKQISISEQNYLDLVNYMKDCFEKKDNSVQMITHPAYGSHDNYFEAKGTYSLFKTCNVWTGNALKSAGIPLGLWTPLAFGVMNNL